MKFTALTRLSFLAFTPFIIAQSIYNLNIDVPMPLTEVVTVTGKQTSDGVSREMSFGTDNPAIADGCYRDGQRHDDCENQIVYRSITQISFDHVTDKARDLVISMPGYNLSCDVSIYDVAGRRDTFWAVDLGLYPQMEYNDVRIGVLCLNQTT